jgi:catechol 2,3-dioxygenase-like lactoylglutathione lyase family enzyme
MTAPALTRVIVSVADLTRALTFYDGLLGLRQKAAPPGFAFLVLGSGPDAVELMLHERTPKPTMAGVALSLRVADVDKLTEEAGRLGCTIIDQPADQSWGERLAVLTDLDGHVICLSEPVS